MAKGKFEMPDADDKAPKKMPKGRKKGMGKKRS